MTTSAGERLASVRRFRCRSALPLLVTASYCYSLVLHTPVWGKHLLFLVVSYFLVRLLLLLVRIPYTLADILLFIVLLLNCNNSYYKCSISVGIN